VKKVGRIFFEHQTGKMKTNLKKKGVLTHEPIFKVSTVVFRFKQGVGKSKFRA